MQGGYFENENISKENPTGQKSRERGGLVPITCKILSDSTVNNDEAIEYQGNLLSDISIVGYLKDYQEMEARVKVKIWDHTGTIDVIFYNKNESESGLSNFYFEGNNKPVKIFGTIKAYKREKNLQGAKILYVHDNELLYHQLEVMNDWLYLTGKLAQLKQESLDNVNESARNLARTNQSNYNNTGSFNNNAMGGMSGYPNTEMNILNSIKDICKNRNRISKLELVGNLEKRFSRDKVSSSLRNLCDQGYLLEEDDYYQVY